MTKQEPLLNKLSKDLDIMMERSVNIFLAYLQPGLSKKEIADLIHQLIKANLQDTHFNFIHLLNNMEDYYQQVNFEEKLEIIESKKS